MLPQCQVWRLQVRSYSCPRVLVGLVEPTLKCLESMKTGRSILVARIADRCLNQKHQWHHRCFALRFQTGTYILEGRMVVALESR